MELKTDNINWIADGSVQVADPALSTFTQKTVDMTEMARVRAEGVRFAQTDFVRSLLAQASARGPQLSPEAMRRMEGAIKSALDAFEAYYNGDTARMNSKLDRAAYSLSLSLGDMPDWYWWLISEYLDLWQMFRVLDWRGIRKKFKNYWFLFRVWWYFIGAPKVRAWMTKRFPHVVQWYDRIPSWEMVEASLEFLAELIASAFKAKPAGELTPTQKNTMEREMRRFSGPGYRW